MCYIGYFVCKAILKSQLSEAKQPKAILKPPLTKMNEICVHDYRSEKESNGVYHISVIGLEF